MRTRSSSKESQADASAARPFFSPQRGSAPRFFPDAVRRKCAPCETDRTVLPQLEVGPVDDPLEAEADAMADQVLRRQPAGTGDDNATSSQVSPTLTVAAADDPAERVADELAERVLSRPGENLSPPVPPPSTGGESAARRSPGAQVHRRCETCNGEEEDPVRKKSPLDASTADAMAAPEAVHEVLRSTGQPMPPSVRQAYEPRFGVDFGHVRVHADEAAAASAEEIGALAYAAGSHVVFGRGQYQPETAAGERLIAHELAHVVQEGHAPDALHRKIGSPRAATADLEPTMAAEGPGSTLTGDENGRAGELVKNVLSSPGQPLDDTSRAFFEPRFGRDFGQVQVHSGSDAAASASALGARGYAVGQHVVLGDGQTPDGESGRRLMAHELAHTIQQSPASTPADAPMPGLEMQGLAPLGVPPRVQRLGPRMLTPPFNPRECAFLLRVESTDMVGPPDAPAGKFKEVWAEFCIPRPRLYDPEGGHIPDDDEAFGPFQKGSYIRVQRFAEIELETGITIEFSIRGFQRTKNSFTTLPANEKEVQALLEADGTSMFELDIVATIDSTNRRSVSLIGSFEHAKKSKTPAPGLHSLMRNVGASEWAAVLIDNPTQYRSILSRLLQADPYLNRYTVSSKHPPPSKSFGTKSEAEAASGSSGFVAGTIITKGADKKYHVYYLQPIDLFWISERARHPNAKGMPPRYAFLDEAFQSLRVGGRTIDKLAEFADAYYLDLDTAQRGNGRAQDALVYRTPDGFYGRYALRRADAFAWWKKLDGMDAGKVGDETLRHWRGYDLGKLVSLCVSGQSEVHVVDAGYLAARDRYKQSKKTLEADRVQVGTRDLDPMSWFLLVASGKEDNFRYLNGELDRPTDAGGGTLLGQIEGSHNLQHGIASFAFDRVNDAARREARAIVKQMQAIVSQLGTTEADLKRVLLAYPKLDAETRKAVVQIMGVEEDDQENTIKTLSSMSNALDIYRGLEVGGVSIARLTRSIAKTRTELGDLLKGLETGKIQAVSFEGDFGIIVRERAYRRLGFSKLKGAEYPHNDSRGLLPDYLEGDKADSANLLERVYGNYVAAQDTAGLLFKIVVVAAVIAVTAALIFFSGGLAAFFAEAFFGGSLVAEIVIGAAIFTGLTEGLAQVMGQGALNTKDWDFGVSKLGVSFLLNVATFGIFRGLSAVMKGWSLAARLGTTYVSFLAFSIGAHMATHQGKLPKGAEWGWLLYETTLMFVLLEAGGYFGRDVFRKMQIAGRNVRAGNLAQTLEGIKTDAETLRADYNKAFETGSRAEKIALGDRYTKVLERQEKLLTELGSLKDVEVNVDVAAELRQIKQHKQAVAEALFLLKSGLRQLGSSPEVFTYSAGPEGADAIKGRFGDKAKGPDADGVITVADSGRTLVFLPERAGAAAKPKAMALSQEPGVRVLAEGVFGIEPRRLEAIKTNITGAGGTVTEVRPGHYTATVGGESFVLVSEKEVRIASLAREAAGKQEGSGKVVIVQSMRSDLAREGLEARLQGEWKDFGEGRLLDRVKALEDAAIAGGRSLNDVLEGEALAARAAKTGAAFGASGQSRTGRIATADAHITALRDQIAFVKSLEDAGLPTGTARTTLETTLASATSTRRELVLNEAGLTGSTTLHRYQPGPEAKALLEARYGAGKVSGPDANQLIRVDIGGTTHVFVPAPEGAAPGAATITVSQGGLGRLIAPGVVALEPKAMRGAKPRVESAGGTWTDAGDGLVVVTLKGETVVVLSEGALRLVPVARAAESATAGSGLATLRSQLRSDLARKGFDEWVNGHRSGRSDADVLAELEVLERTEAGKKRDARSLHAVFEAEAIAVAEARARADLVKLIKATNFVKDPWVERMIQRKNSNELRGVLAEMRVHQMKTAEIATDPRYAGRKVSVIDKVWVLAKQPEASVADWVAANPRPSRANFSDQKSFEDADKAYNRRKAGMKDVPGGGVGEQVKDVDHVVVEEVGGKLDVLGTVETKYDNVQGQATQATEARDALVDAIRLGTARGGTAIIGRADNNAVVEVLTGKLQVSGTPTAEVRHPDLDVDALAKDIVKNPTAYEP